MPNTSTAPRWAKAILIVGVIAALLLALGPLGYKLQVLPLVPALLLPVAGLALGALTLLAGLVALAFIFTPERRAARVPVFMGMGVAALVVLVMGLQLLTGGSAPPIHDISTDLADPPTFVRVPQLRGAADNSLEFEAATVAEPTRTAYPWVQPLATPLKPAAAIARARETAEGLGWEVVHADPGEGLLEATDTTFWYGFKDDVVIRVRPTPTGSRIDLRSASRVGLSDLGANARRIGQFIAAFDAH